MVSVMQALNEQRRYENAMDNARVQKPASDLVMQKTKEAWKYLNTVDNKRDVNVETAITFGGKDSKTDVQSGSIMKVLAAGIEGFHSRIANGVKNGHTYNIIHMPNSRHFLFEDRYPGLDGKQETSRQSFVIDAYHETEEAEHDEWVGMMDDVNREADEIITMARA